MGFLRNRGSNSVLLRVNRSEFVASARRNSSPRCNKVQNKIAVLHTSPRALISADVTFMIEWNT